MASDLATIELRKQVKKFVVAYCDTGDPTASAILSGMEQASAASAGCRLLQQGEVVAAIQMEVGKRLVAGAALGFRVLKKLASDESDESAGGRKIRLDAAKELLKLGGHVGPRSTAASDAGAKSLHEMTLDELRGQQSALTNAIAERAKEVSAPHTPSEPNEAIDLLD